MKAEEFADKVEHLIGAYRAGALTPQEFLAAVDELITEMYE